MIVHFASLERAGVGAYQLSLTLVRAPSDKTIELEPAIARFEAQCSATGLCAAAALVGLQNWRTREGSARTTLYFSMVPSWEEGNGENGNGISASGSAAYAKIWERYACS